MLVFIIFQYVDWNYATVEPCADIRIMFLLEQKPWQICYIQSIWNKVVAVLRIMLGCGWAAVKLLLYWVVLKLRWKIFGNLDNLVQLSATWTFATDINFLKSEVIETPRGNNLGMAILSQISHQSLNFSIDCDFSEEKSINRDWFSKMVFWVKLREECVHWFYFLHLLLH